MSGACEMPSSAEKNKPADIETNNSSNSIRSQEENPVEQSEN
jgi:hypothetical protein